MTAETAIRYIESTGGTHTLSNGNTGKYLRGEGMDAWVVKPVWDEVIGDARGFAGYDLAGGQEIALHFAIGADSYENARGTLATWRHWFWQDVSRDTRGTVQVVYNGGTYSRDAAVTAPEIEGPDGQYIGVALKFESASPFWAYGAEQTANGTAGPGTAIVTFDNSAGDYLSYPTHVLTGAWGTVTITYPATNEYIQIGTVTANAADQVWIWSDKPLVRYYAGGTAAGDPDSGANWTGFGGTASRWFGVRPAAGTVTVQVSSGTAVYQMRYTRRKAGLG